jgi:hypothetical protein
MFWCEIGQTEQWYFIEDVFDFIDNSAANRNGDFIDYVTEISNLIETNAAGIFNLFNTAESQNMRNAIKELAKKG